MEVSSVHADIEYNANRKNIYRKNSLAMEELKKDQANRKYFDAYGGKGKKIKFPEFNNNINARLQRYSKELDELAAMDCFLEMSWICSTKIDELLRRIDAVISRRGKASAEATELRESARSLRLKIKDARGLKLEKAEKNLKRVEEAVESLSQKLAPQNEFYDYMRDIEEIESVLGSINPFDKDQIQKLEKVKKKCRSLNNFMISVADKYLKLATEEMQNSLKQYKGLCDKVCNEREWVTLKNDLEEFKRVHLDAVSPRNDSDRIKLTIVRKDWEDLNIKVINLPDFHLEKLCKEMEGYERQLVEIKENGISKSGLNELWNKLDSLMLRHNEFQDQLFDHLKDEHGREENKKLFKRVQEARKVFAELPAIFLASASKQIADWFAEFQKALAMHFPTKEEVLSLNKNLETLKINFIEPMGDMESVDSNVLADINLKRISFRTVLLPWKNRLGLA